MRRLERYTDEEWMMIAGTPSMIGSAMAGAASSGMGTVKELMANMRTVVEGKQMYPENDVIQAIIAKPESREQAKEDFKAYREKAMARIKENNITKAAEIKDMAMGDLKEVLGLLQTKEIESHITEYKHWILNIAQTVAEAAKEGGILGFGGVRVSEEEEAFLQELSTLLQVEAV